MAKTVKSGGKCWSEGVEVPCPKKEEIKKKIAKKATKKKEIDLKKEWSKEAQRRKSIWGN